MSKLYHPDINKNVDPNIIIKINLAYEMLGDEDKKKKYDADLQVYLKNKQNDKKYYQQEPTDEHNFTSIDKIKPKSKWGKIFLGSIEFVASTFQNQMYTIQKEMENAYYDSSVMSDETLINSYLKSKGSKRNGYAQALLDRGLLFKEDGRLMPSYTFIKILKRLG